MTDKAKYNGWTYSGMNDEIIPEHKGARLVGSIDLDPADGAYGAWVGLEGEEPEHNLGGGGYIRCVAYLSSYADQNGSVLVNLKELEQ